VKHRSVIALFLGALSLVALAACAPGAAGPEPTEGPEGQTWQLASYLDADGSSRPALADAPVTLIFAGSELSGSAGCNGYSAGYERNGEELTIKPPTATLMACSEEIDRQEAAYLGLLPQAVRFERAGEELTLVDGDDRPILSFTVQPPPSLIGTAWLLASYADAEGVATAVVTTATAVFGQDGTLSGSAGCNSYSAGYEVNGDRITIKAPISTRMFCEQPAGVMEQEAAFLAAIERAASFEIAADELTLRDGEGEVLATLAQARR
jgi:heat shock protein HslJ